MPYREVGVIEVREVLRLWGLGRSYRAIGLLTGVDRKTVRRYVSPRRLDARIGVSTSSAFAGTNAALVLERP